MSPPIKHHHHHHHHSNWQWSSRDITTMEEPSSNNLQEATNTATATELWHPPSPEQTQIYSFKQQISQKYKQHLPTYHDLWQWSVDHPAAFWGEVWEFAGVKASRTYSEVGREFEEKREM